MTEETQRVATKRKTWRFAWCREDSPPKNGDSHDWRSKSFRAKTFRKAMDLMLAYIERKPFACLVDYECRAEHMEYNPDAHEETYPRIDRTGHGLTQYMS